MFISPKRVEPLAPEHAAFFVEFMALSHAHRENIMTALLKARATDCTERITNYIDDNKGEFFVFDIGYSQIAHGAYGTLRNPEELDCRIIVRRDMTYGRIVAVDDFMLDMVMYESDEPDKVVLLYNYALDVSKS